MSVWTRQAATGACAPMVIALWPMAKPAKVRKTQDKRKCVENQNCVFTHKTLVVPICWYGVYMDRCGWMLGAEYSVRCKQNVFQHERELPVYRHTLPSKLPERSKHRVSLPPHSHYSHHFLVNSYNVSSLYLTLGSAWRTVLPMIWSAPWARMHWSTSCCPCPSASLPIRTLSGWSPTPKMESSTPARPS